MKKFIVPTIVIGIIAVGFIIFIVKINRSAENSDYISQTENWKIYKNEAFDFQISYPENYIYNDNIQLKNNDEKAAIFFYAQDQYDKLTGEFNGLPKFSILIIDNFKKSELNQWIIDRMGVGKLAFEEVQFGANDFLRIKQAITVDFYVHLLAKNSSIYMISSPVYKKKAPEIYSDILGSFAFTI